MVVVEIHIAVLLSFCMYNSVLCARQQFEAVVRDQHYLPYTGGNAIYQVLVVQVLLHYGHI